MHFRYHRTTAVNLNLHRVCALGVLRWSLLLTLWTEALQVTSAGYQRLFPASLLLSDSVDTVANCICPANPSAGGTVQHGDHHEHQEDGAGTILISLFDMKRGAKFSLPVKRQIGRK